VAFLEGDPAAAGMVPGQPGSAGVPERRSPERRSSVGRSGLLVAQQLLAEKLSHGAKVGV
jgi:hypothetical protein